MCGICGIIDFNGAPVRRQSIEKMADSLWHRGPDDAGYHFEPAVEWFRSDLLERAHELMFESNEWLNVPYLRLLWNRHHNKIQDHSAILWGVCMFRQWQGLSGTNLELRATVTMHLQRRNTRVLA
jgi:hypothetical protein